MTQAATPMPSVADLPALISRETLFGNPERARPQLSPDGKFLAYLAPDDKNVLQVWLREIEQEAGQESEPAKAPEEPSCSDQQLTADKKRGIRSYFWTYDGQHLIYMQDADGDENFHCYSVEIHTRIVRDLTPFQGVKADPIELDPEYPDQFLIGMNLKDPQIFDVYRVNLQTGAVEFDTPNPGNIISWLADSQFQIRGAMAAAADGGSDLLYRETPEQAWEVLRHWGPEDEGYPLSFSADGKTLYIVGSHDFNAQRLLALDLTTRQETVIAEDAQYDVGGVVTHPTDHRLQAVAFFRDRLDWQVLDERIADDFAALAAIRPGDFSLNSRTLADDRWLVAFTTDNGPVYYYVYERASKTATLLFSNQPALEQVTLASMQPITYAARDGLTIHGYLTLPVGIPAQNLPAVLLVHGGPWARDTWGYDPEAQWLANRGYAVLQVNFRGSTGYGKAFLSAGNREWAAKMHDDLLDAVEWLVGQGIADREKVAIMGDSYGGYATLVGLTFTPDVFAAGVDIVGPSNIMTLLQSIPPYWEPIKAQMYHRIGNLETEEDFLKSRSPLFFIDRIQKPLLIGQGANDPRVKQAESDQIVEAMRKAGKPVEYALYPDEGHGFARPENRLHFYAVAEAFLTKYLGGRSEPVGDIPGHSGLLK